MINVLSINSVPPPIHGSNVINHRLNSSLRANKNVYFVHVDYSFVSEINQIGLFSLKKIKKLFQVIREIFGVLKSVKFEIVYFPIVIGRTVLWRDLIVLCLVQALTNDTKIVTHFHSKGLYRHNWLTRTSLFYCLKEVHVIHLSESLIELPDRFKKNCTVIPNSVEMPRIKPNDSKTPTLAFFSNLIEEKGIDIFIESCYKLSLQNVKFKAQIAGREGVGYSATYLKQRIEELGLSRIVKYVGLVQSEKKIDFLNSSDVLLLPTRYKNECMPVSLLEGMTYGCYVLSTNEGAIPDIVLPGLGLIVEANAEIIAIELEKLISSDLLSFKNRAERSNRAIGLFSNGVMECKFINLLNELCAE